MTVVPAPHFAVVLERPGWIWLLALAVPIVVLHLRWRRRRSAEVSSLGPWRDLAASGVARRGMRRIEDALPLFLLLTALAAASAAAAGPVAGSAPPPPRRLAIVLDESASMNAVLPAGGTRFDEARTAALAAVERLAPEDDVVVWGASAEPRILLDPERDHEVVREMLRSARPTLRASGLGVTAALAARALGAGRAGSRETALLVLSDRSATRDEMPSRAIVGVAGLSAPPAANAGVVWLALRDGALFAGVRATDGNAVPRRVVVSADGKPLAAAGSVATVPWPGAARGDPVTELRVAESLPATGGLVEVRLDPPDDFPEDDTARLLLAAERPARLVVVANDLSVSPRLLDALRALGPLVSGDAKVALPSVVSFGDADVIVEDGAEASAVPADRAVISFRGGPESATAARLWAKGTHPVVAGVDLSPMRLLRSAVLSAGPADVVAAETERGPVIVCGERHGTRFVRFGFLAGEPSMALEPPLVLLLRNALRWVARPPAIAPQLRAGGVFAFADPFPPGVGRVWMEGPGALPLRPLAVDGGRVAESVPLPPPGGPYGVRISGLPAGDIRTVVQWTPPDGFALNVDAPVSARAVPLLSAADAALAVPDLRAATDTRVRLAPLCAGLAALAVVVLTLLPHRRPRN